MLWCQGAQDIGLSNHKLKSALKCAVRSQCTCVPDRQTDRHTDGRTETNRQRDGRTSWQ